MEEEIAAHSGNSIPKEDVAIIDVDGSEDAV